MKATEQVVLPVVLFTLLSKVVLTFEYVNEILNGDHSNGYWAIVLVILFIMLYKVVLALETAVEILEGYHSKKKTTEQYFPVALHITLYKEVLAVDAAHES